MHRRLTVSMAVGVLLAGGTPLNYLSSPPQLQLNSLMPGPRSNLEHCLHSARIVFDVHWAVACTREAEQGVPGADGNAECELSDGHAAAVNAWLDNAEAQCMAEAP